jgi:hypothetical protein
METLIYDADPTSICTRDRPCPKFVLNKKTGVVSLIDKQGNKANMSIAHFNKFVMAAKTGKIKEVR